MEHAGVQRGFEAEMLNDAEDAIKTMKADIDVAVEKARNTIAALRSP